MTDNKKSADWNDVHREQGTETARETFDQAMRRGEKEARAKAEARRREFEDDDDDDEVNRAGEGGQQEQQEQQQEEEQQEEQEEQREDQQAGAGDGGDGADAGGSAEQSGAQQQGAQGASGATGQTAGPQQARPGQQRRASLPAIKISEGNLHGVIEQAEKAILAASEQHLFQRGGMLVRLKRIAKKETTKGVTRDAGSLMIAEATVECVRLEMARTARYRKWNVRAKKYVVTDPPIKYARAMAAKDEFSFKTLLATIETPTLRPDGSVLQTPGYDEASGLYFDSALSFPTIDNNPSKNDAGAALREIDKVLKDFPFVDGSRAVANAAILTALVRRVLPAAPMFLFDAPVASSGKSLLAQVTARIATGRDPATQPFTGEPEEDRKRIVASLIAADAVVSFDNISKPLQDDTLCRVLTQPEIDDRVLCTMTNVRVPTCTTFLGTGVNLVVNGREMVRRVEKCRIDPNMEHPEQRKFDYVLLDYVMEQRVRLVAAALTVMRAYIAAGRPEQNLKPYGGFEAWTTMVRAPLVWLGCDDPHTTREEVKDAADPDTEKLGNLLDALADRFNTAEFTTAEVVQMARKDAYNTATYGSDLSALQQALAALCWKGEINSTAVGKGFSKYRDRIVNGRKLTRGDIRHHAATWKVEIIQGRQK